MQYHKTPNLGLKKGDEGSEVKELQEDLSRLGHNVGKADDIFRPKTEKADLIILDPPYFDKKAEEYAKKSISGLSRQEYLKFLESFFVFMKKLSKKTTRLAFINADWRDFQNRSATEEDPKNSILLIDYCKILENAGWALTHIIQAPMSSERFDRGSCIGNAKEADSRSDQPVCDSIEVKVRIVFCILEIINQN